MTAIIPWAGSPRAFRRRDREGLQSGLRACAAKLVEEHWLRVDGPKGRISKLVHRSEGLKGTGGCLEQERTRREGKAGEERSRLGP